MDSIEGSLVKVAKTCEDVQALFITDRDGVLIVRIGEELRASKLNLGSHKISLFTYEQTQVVIMVFTKMTVFICAKPTANTGKIMQLRSDIEKILPTIEKVVPTLIAETSPCDPNSFH